MTTLTPTMTRQDQERARLLGEIAHLQTELTQSAGELARTWARVYASEQAHLYTHLRRWASGIARSRWSGELGRGTCHCFSCDQEMPVYGYRW